MSPSLQPLRDTENAAWTSDKTKFGYRMLQKMGWEEGKGLGANENGVKEHVRVRKKLSLAGVGAAGTNAGWEVPAKVAAGLNDVLAGLTAMGARVVEGERRDKVEKRRGYYERRRAEKCVANYSKEDLREIFGGTECKMGEKLGEVDTAKAKAVDADANEGHRGEDERDQENRKQEGGGKEERERKEKRREERRRRRKLEGREQKKSKGNRLEKLKVKSEIKKTVKGAKKTRKEKSKR